MNTMIVEIGKQYRNRKYGKNVTVTNITVHTDGSETQAIVEYQSPLSAEGIEKPEGTDELFRVYADEMDEFCKRFEPA